MTIEVAARDRFARAAAAGRLCLPVCPSCGACQYPIRDVCAECLAPCADDKELDGIGSIIASATLHRSNDERFRSRLPLQIASVRLDAGPVVLAFLAVAPRAGRVRITASCDADGRPVLTAGDVER